MTGQRSAFHVAYDLIVERNRIQRGEISRALDSAILAAIECLVHHGVRAEFGPAGFPAPDYSGYGANVIPFKRSAP